MRRFGKRGLISLSFGLVAGRIFPTLKYGLGYGRDCTQLTIGGEPQPVSRELTKAA